MKISEYIHELEKIKDEIGDVEVEHGGFNGRCTAQAPCIGYRRILKGRERQLRFWNTWDGEENKGEATCRV